MNNEEYKI